MDYTHWAIPLLGGVRAESVTTIEMRQGDVALYVMQKKKNWKTNKNKKNKKNKKKDAIRAKRGLQDNN